MPLLEINLTRYISASVRLDEATAERIDQYAAFVHASADDVVDKALNYVFSKDRDFQDFLKTPQAKEVEGVRVPSEVSDNSDVRGEEWRRPEPTDLIFPKWQSELFKTITEEENLRFDRDGRPRTAYSLRHTYISMRLMEGANIYQIAKNCRTSVGMIEKYYGVHVKNSLNAAAINVVRSGKDEMAEEEG